MKAFRADLKDVLRRVGVERQPCLLLLEDHQLVATEMLEYLNSLLSGGEVSWPGAVVAVCGAGAGHLPPCMPG